MSKSQEHGSLTTYTSGCHCPECRAAMASYQKARRAKGRKRPEPWAKHGGSRVYQQGCRCDECKDWQRNRALGRYGLTREDFHDMLSSQHHTCAICNCKLTEETAHVDHDHYSGATRALLCRNCNVGLGNFNDSIENLANAIKYLEVHKSRGA